jgi:hypothetical protein
MQLHAYQFDARKKEEVSLTPATLNLKSSEAQIKKIKSRPETEQPSSFRSYRT